MVDRQYCNLTQNKKDKHMIPYEGREVGDVVLERGNHVKGGVEQKAQRN